MTADQNTPGIETTVYPWRGEGVRIVGGQITRHFSLSWIDPKSGEARSKEFPTAEAQKAFERDNCFAPRARAQVMGYPGLSAPDLEELAARMFRAATRTATGNEWDWGAASDEVKAGWRELTAGGEEAGWGAYRARLRAAGW